MDDNATLDLKSISPLRSRHPGRKGSVPRADESIEGFEIERDTLSLLNDSERAFLADGSTSMNQDRGHAAVAIDM